MALALFALAIFIPAAQYWAARGWGVAHCLYGDKDCSSAFATYLLCTLTVGGVLISLRTLLDTADSVATAVSTLEHQKTAILATQKCLHENCSATFRQKNVYVTAFDESPSEKLEEQSGLTHKDFYDPVPVDCLSVGLAPILSAQFVISLRDKNGTTRATGNVVLGTLTTGDRLHLNVYVRTTLVKESEILFTSPQHQGLGDTPTMKDLEYHASGEKLIPQVNRTASDEEPVVSQEATEPKPNAKTGSENA